MEVLDDSQAVGLRTKACADRYRAFQEAGHMDNRCVCCDLETVQSFTHWRIVANDFPYDLIAKAHDMIVPIRHVTEDGLREEEKQEFKQIKNDYLQRYNFIMEASEKTKTVPGHFHLHLITTKNEHTS